MVRLSPLLVLAAVTEDFGTLIEDPDAWGYLPLNNSASFIPKADSVDPPFKLHLVGSGMMNLPLELKDVVVFHVGLNYDQYYAIMAGMDVCVPAFGPSSDYYTLQASSTVSMCMETNVSLVLQTRDVTSYVKLG